jgi:hypothetical protein
MHKTKQSPFFPLPFLSHVILTSSLSTIIHNHVEGTLVLNCVDAWTPSHSQPTLQQPLAEESPADSDQLAYVSDFAPYRFFLFFLECTIVFRHLLYLLNLLSMFACSTV